MPETVEILILDPKSLGDLSKGRTDRNKPASPRIHPWGGGQAILAQRLRTPVYFTKDQPRIIDIGDLQPYFCQPKEWP